jgi:RimJ/RimL family protein N-acetyltransferase
VIYTQLLRGERVWLSALSHDDAPVIARWEYDTEFLRLMDSRPARPRSEEEVARWLEGLGKATNNYTFGIRLIENDNLIGFVELDGIDWQHGSSALGIAIGPRTHWDSGYGSEAMQLALRFAFDELNLHRIFLTVFSYNARAIHLYEKLGFTLEGRYREHLQRDGQRYDMLIYGLLRHEWAGR